MLWDFSGDVWNGTYHSKTLSTAREEISSILSVPAIECTQHAMFTNLVRCTSSKLGTEAVQIGVEWLREEIRLWQPPLLLLMVTYLVGQWTDMTFRMTTICPTPQL